MRRFETNWNSGTFPGGDPSKGGDKPLAKERSLDGSKFDGAVNTLDELRVRSTFETLIEDTAS